MKTERRVAAIIRATRRRRRRRRLKEILQSELHDARIGASGIGGYVAESAAGVGACWIGEDSLVGNIECLPAKLEALTLVDMEVARQRHIELITPWPNQAKWPLGTKGADSRASPIRGGNEITLGPKPSASTVRIGGVDCICGAYTGK